MQALRFHAAGDIRLEEVEEPLCAPGTVKIRVHWCGLCGTDPHEYESGPVFIPTKDQPHPLTAVICPSLWVTNMPARSSSISRGWLIWP
jgi:(R,R)-butanediol dehydrogenase/meso-butanediol dehydrogenase/diacetyl reductase